MSPCNVGPRSTPDYEKSGSASRSQSFWRHQVFAGQRAEGFYVDLGSIFDLGPAAFQNLHLIPLPATQGVNGTQGLNVHTIAIQVPKTLLTSDGSNPTKESDSHAAIGVWARASRRKALIIEGNGSSMRPGPGCRSHGWLSH